MYGICCVPFLFGKPLVKNTFFKSFPKKNAPQIVNLKNPDFDLIRRIHPECGFYGFTIRFWICPKNAKSIFGSGNPDLDFPKKHTWSESNSAVTINKESKFFIRQIERFSWYCYYFILSSSLGFAFYVLLLYTLFLSWFCILCEKARNRIVSIINVTMKTDVLRAFSVNLLWMNS